MARRKIQHYGASLENHAQQEYREAIVGAGPLHAMLGALELLPFGVD